MMELAEFLLARIAEDEAAALEAMGYESRVSVSPSKSAAHYARWDPDRVYAECEAKRRIVEREESRLRTEWRRYSDEHRQSYEEWLKPPRGEILRLLAAPYASHPDYREVWAP